MYKRGDGGAAVVNWSRWMVTVVMNDPRIGWAGSFGTGKRKYSAYRGAWGDRTNACTSSQGLFSRLRADSLRIGIAGEYYCSFLVDTFEVSRFIRDML